MCGSARVVAIGTKKYVMKYVSMNVIVDVLVDVLSITVSVLDGTVGLY